MPTFLYAATDQQGHALSGARAAATRQELIGHLRAENLVITSVREDTGVAPAARAPGSDLLSSLLQGRVRQSDLLVFTRQLSAMLKAGVSLTDALHTIAMSVGNPRLHDILMKVRMDVQRGRTLADSMRQHPAAFDQLFATIIHAGESSGSLAQNVARLSDYLARRENFRRKLRSATAYPKFVLGFFTVITAGIFLFLIPRFKEIFEDFGAKLPPLTQACMSISAFMRNNFIWLAPLAVLLAVGVVVLGRTPRGRMFFDRMSLKVPFFGKLAQEAAVARMGLTLSTLLSNGIPLTDALQTSGGTLGNMVLEEGMHGVRRDVMKGHTLAESLSRVEEFPRLLSRMVRVGEESGTLSGMLGDVANYYDQEVDHALTRITAVIEPVLICGMGVIVLITVVAIYLPIFTMGKTMSGGH